MKRVTHDIVQSIKKPFYVFLGPISKTYVMQKVLANLGVVDFVPKSIKS